MPERLDMDQEAPVASAATTSAASHSLARVPEGTAGPESDIDLLVEFEAGHAPGLIALAGIELELSAMLGGRKVDLRTPGDLSRFFRDEVVRSAAVQYAT